MKLFGRSNKNTQSHDFRGYNKLDKEVLYVQAELEKLSEKDKYVSL